GVALGHPAMAPPVPINPVPPAPPDPFAPLALPAPDPLVVASVLAPSSALPHATRVAETAAQVNKENRLRGHGWMRCSGIRVPPRTRPLQKRYLRLSIGSALPGTPVARVRGSFHVLLRLSKSVVIRRKKGKR